MTTSIICPFRLDQLTNIQTAFVNAFNRSMYLINPILDLPEVEENALFNVDVYIGGDKLADVKLSLNDIEIVLKHDSDEKKIN